MAVDLLFVAPPRSLIVGDSGLLNHPPRTNFSIPAAILLGSLIDTDIETDFLDCAADAFDTINMRSPGVLVHGLQGDDLTQAIRERAPKCICVTAMFSYDYPIVCDALRAIRRGAPTASIVVGGIAASAAPDWFANLPEVDLVCVGRAESRMQIIMEAVTSRTVDTVPGCAWISSNGILRRTPNSITEPAISMNWEMRKVMQRRDGSNRYMVSETRKNELYNSAGDVASCVLYASRGCPMGCEYCATTAKDGRIVEHVGAEQAASFLSEMEHKYGVRAWYNQSDTFGLHEEDWRLIERIAQMEGPRVLSNPNAFFVRVLMRGREPHVDRIRALRDAGFGVVTIAVESSVERFSSKVPWRQIGRDGLRDLVHCVRRDHGMPVEIYMMYGFPGQTEAEFSRDLDFAESIVDDIDQFSWHFAGVFPGTEYYEKYVRSTGGVRDYLSMLDRGVSCYDVSNNLNLSEVSADVLRAGVRRFQQPGIPLQKSWLA